MESEKVKEIKKVAIWGDVLNKIGYYKKRFKYTKEINVLIWRIIELESENERLMKLQARGGCRVAELGIENQQLKDRIAELEKENKELLKENEGYHGSYRCAIDKIGKLSAERYIKVEQFAESLKEKFYYEGRICRYIIDSDVFDETLKEFI